MSTENQSLVDWNHRSILLDGGDSPNSEPSTPSDVYERNSFLRLPPEIRAKIYDILLPHTETMYNTQPTQHKYIRWRHGHMAIMRTCRLVHRESSRLLYSTRDFQLTCGDDHFRFTPFWLPKGRLLPGVPFEQSLGERNVAQSRSFHSKLLLNSALDP